MNFNDPNELAERYTAVWMEPDGDRRRKAIADLWSEDAIHILQAHAGGLRGRRSAGRQPDLAGARPRRTRSEGDLSLRGFRGDRPDVFSVAGRRETPWGCGHLALGRSLTGMARCSAPASSSRSSPLTAG